MKKFAKQGIDEDDEDEDDNNDDDNNDDNLRVFCVSSNDYQCLKEVNEPPTVCKLLPMLLKVEVGLVNVDSNCLSCLSV